MKFRTALTAFVFALLVAAQSSAGKSGQKLHRYANKVPDKYIVVLTDQYKPLAAQSATALAAAYPGQVIGIFDKVLGGFAIHMPEARAIALSEDPRVAEVHECVPIYISGSGQQQYPPSWGLDRIDTRLLSDMNGWYTWAYSGAGVTAYVLDTGVNEVGDVAGRIDAHVLCWSGDATCVTSWLTTYDCAFDNHGTKVASTLGGSMYGVARDVRFKDVQALSGCVGPADSSHLVKGLNWVVSDHLARDPSGTANSVANVSLDFGVVITPIDVAVRDTIAAGVSVVVGAGNSGVNACNASPGLAGNAAMLPDNPNGFSAITVAASNQADTVVSRSNASWASNTGPCVDLFAPGIGLHASDYLGGEGSFEGTSAAAPHVAGLVAIRLEKYGHLDPAAVESSIRYWATPNVLTGVPADTPNLLVFTYESRPRPCCIF